MRRTRICKIVGIALSIIILGLPTLARSQSDELPKLRSEAERMLSEGKHREAVLLAERYVTIARQRLGEEHAEYATAISTLADGYAAQRQHDRAQPLYQRALTIAEKTFGPNGERTRHYLDALAKSYEAAQRYQNAIALYARLVAMAGPAGGEELLTALTNQGRALLHSGDYSEAEQSFTRGLLLAEKLHGANHPDTGTLLQNLAGAYRMQGRFAEAEPLFKRSVAIAETAGSRRDLAVTLTNLAGLYYFQQRFPEAEPLYRKAIAIQEKEHGAESYNVGRIMNDLGALHYSQRNYGEAARLFEQAKEKAEKNFGPESPEVASALTNLGAVLHAQGDRAGATAFYTRSLEITERALGSDHPRVLGALRNLARAQTGSAAAIRYYKRHTDLIVRRTARGSIELGRQGGNTEAERQSEFLWDHMREAYELWRLDSAKQGNLLGEMFETAQWMSQSSAAQMLAQMAARGVGPNIALASLVRERQDLVREWGSRDAARTAAVADLPDKRDHESEKANVARIDALDKRITEINRQLATQFPGYNTLMRPSALSLRETQTQLRANEALVLFVSEPRGVSNKGTFVWAVTKTTARWFRVEKSALDLANDVAALRCGLDYTAWAGQGREHCGNLLALNETPRLDALPFPHARAHDLYKVLFSQIDDLIKGKLLLLVSSGALSQLPFHVLVATAPATDRPDHRSVDWLARKHAISVLPSVASLHALRHVAKPSRATLPWIGFGNPELDGADPHSESAILARAKQACMEGISTRVASLPRRNRGISPIATRNGLADVKQIRSLAPLPETADELCTVGQALGASASEVYIGAKATERQIKTLSENGALSRFRILHFATHATLAGQLEGTKEPGLILTPPDASSPADDGYLTASDVAGLKLDADWVILSACNTAAGASNSSEPFTGLAQAFFYAQARALLVSHWEVYSEATVKLVTSAVGTTTRDKAVGRSEALRRAMLHVMEKGELHEAHPAYWAPFVLVGEGAGVR